MAAALWPCVQLRHILLLLLKSCPDLQAQSWSAEAAQRAGQDPSFQPLRQSHVSSPLCLVLAHSNATDNKTVD